VVLQLRGADVPLDYGFIDRGHMHALALDILSQVRACARVCACVNVCVCP
jgi:hypothetical protein